MGFPDGRCFPTAIERSPSALVREARSAYEAELFIACLTVLVTIPDVCSRLAGCGGNGYRSWCETYLGLEEGIPPEEINRSSEQSRGEIDCIFERLKGGLAFTSSDLCQLRNAVLHAGSSKTEGRGARYSQCHAIGVYVTDSDDSLLCGLGAMSRPTTRDVEEGCRFEVVISLTGLLSRMELAVQRFLSEYPECDREHGKGSSLHWGIVDMRTSHQD